MNRAWQGWKTPQGGTAVTCAAERGHTGCVTALANLGADLETRTPDGSTALILAAQNGHLSSLKALVTHGADANVVTSDGRTGLIAATIGGHVPCIRALIAAGADQGSSTALKIAREKGNEQAAEMLKLGIYVRAKSMWGPPRAGRF